MLAAGHLALRRLCRANALDPTGTRLQNQCPETIRGVSKCFATTEAVGWRWSHMPRPRHTEQAGFGLPGEKTAGARRFHFSPAFPEMTKK